jgi:hypothetical protein
MIENAFWDVISLDGVWDFRLGERAWRTIAVPGAWELQVGDLLSEGPAVYRRRFALESVTECVLLECDAISFAAVVRVNGIGVGQHTGMWSAFQLDVTDALRMGENEIEIEVRKAGQEHYPLRECLAGFLPDVANTFGGIWQGVRLRLGNGVGFSNVKVWASGNGRLEVSAQLTSANQPGFEPQKALEKPGLFARATEARICHFCHIEVLERGTNRICTAKDVTLDQDSFLADLPTTYATTWETGEQIHLYDVVLTALNTSHQPVVQTRRRMGFRDISTRKDTTLLNNQPLHVRGVLGWGWDAQRLCPTPTREDVRVMFAKCRALGFNLFKLCLYVPDPALFEVADEEGMLLWLELPMWLPKVTPAFKELALREYEAILRRVHHHPSIAIVSLGCELDNEADAEFLQQLAALAHAWLPNALHCQNSGSAEAYGGPIHSDNSNGDDFYDYHFYTDPHFFQPLVDHFSRAYKPEKPWIYGEFCDADTMRDFGSLPSPGRRGEAAWWLTQPLTMQRDELTWMQRYAARLDEDEADGIDLVKLGRQQALAIRKFILEQTRKRSATGGYVLTGWQDTPITTSGIVDDWGELKFDASAFAQFNADRVLVLDRERRRKWTHGGDRPVHHDPCVVWQGQPFELHLSLSNGASAIKDAQLTWQLDEQHGVVDGVSVGAGGLQELVALPVSLPHSNAIHQHTLHAQLHHAQGLTQNTWSLWSVPKQPIDFSRVVYGLSDEAIARAQQGQRLLAWLREPDERLTQPMPFWREAIHVLPGQMPGTSDSEIAEVPGIFGIHGADLRYFGVATDFAMNLAKVRQALATWGVSNVRPVWRRFDARATTWAEYVIEAHVGAGSLVLSTLRFAGGLGAQPSSLEMNPMGWWLMRQLLFGQTFHPHLGKPI